MTTPAGASNSRVPVIAVGAIIALIVIAIVLYMAFYGGGGAHHGSGY